MAKDVLTGAELVIRALEYLKVSTVFGLPGGAILPAYDPLYDSPIRHVLVRHEQGAGHMAEGYAQATGELGVVVATSGPGATNLVTSLANALMDSTPILAITGQVASTSIGNDAFQEAYTVGLTMAATKHNYLITKASEIPQVILEAKHIATTGRPGPVLVDIPKDILNEEAEWVEPVLTELPGYKPTLEANPKMIQQAVDLIVDSKKPILYVGGGIIHSKANKELFELSTKYNIPVVTTLMGRGAFPDGHELCIGMPGMHGNYTATTSIQKSDLLIALGVRFDDRVTANPQFFAQNAKVIHADIDPAEIGKVREPEVPIVGDAKSVINGLIEKLGNSEIKNKDWIKEIEEMKKNYPLTYNQDEKGPLKVPYVLEELQKMADKDSIVVSGVGQHQMWISLHWKFTSPNTWLNSGGLGTMGYALPAAIGAKAAYPDKQVLALDGDGCFQMTCQELITASTENIPLKIVVFNNGNHGMVRQWQKIFYNHRFSASELTHHTPDYVALAESMGAVGLRMIEKSDVKRVFDEMFKIEDRPVLVDCVVDPDDMVFPMVPAGGSNDVVLLNEDDLKKL
ncbi:MAG: biosynthetic-type acetolactate synthase large subunit [Actinomycetota bacterium]|nr:biosynthetic-type acetolactate synthase large subunit [Actinomycetota bacterium]